MNVQVTIPALGKTLLVPPLKLFSLFDQIFFFIGNILPELNMKHPKKGMVALQQRFIPEDL